MGEPISFIDVEIRAIRDGSKTQFRVPLKAQPPQGCRMICASGVWSWELDGEFIGESKCPYQPGDRLWVRETYHECVNTWVEDHYEPDGSIYYRADSPDLWRRCWTSPALMPRCASRITLEVLRVWPEQLQEITIDDLWAEGMDRDMWAPTQFQIRWNKLYAKKGQGWNTNLWVACNEFKVVK